MSALGGTFPTPTSAPLRTRNGVPSLRLQPLPASDYDAAWGERTGDLYLNEEADFANVPELVWTYQLGGYPVLKKWLGYRQADRRDGKALTDDERRWFRQIIQRIAANLLPSGYEPERGVFCGRRRR